MNIEKALTQEILAHPDDDLPRLALADWLEEHGRQQQGELVRVQIELARTAEEDERRPLLLSRQAWLLARHGKELGRPLRGLARRWEFRRGCVEGVTLPAGQFPSRAAELFARAPLRHLHLAAPQDHAALAACPQLARISELTLTADPIRYTRYDPLLSSPHLQGLRSLRLCSGNLELEALQAISALPDLEELELRSCACAAPRPALVPLEAPGSLPRLRSLKVCGWPGPVTWRSVVGRLEVLASQNEAGGNAVVLRRLATPGRTTPLRSLFLVDVVPNLDVVPLLASGVLADLHTLKLPRCGLSVAAVSALGGAGGPARLVHLDLGSNLFGRPGVEALMRLPHLSHLTHLGLAWVGIQGKTSGLVRPLCTASPPRLAALDLRGNQVTADEVLDLADSPLSAQLYWLDLRHNHLGDEGAEALLCADWPRLAWLDVRDNDLSSAAQAALRQRFGYSVYY